MPAAEGVGDGKKLIYWRKLFMTSLRPPEIFHSQSFSLPLSQHPSCVLLKLSSIMSGAHLGHIGGVGPRPMESSTPSSALFITKNWAHKKILSLASCSTWFNKILIYLLMYFNKQRVLHFLWLRKSHFHVLWGKKVRCCLLDGGVVTAPDNSEHRKYHNLCSQPY